MNSEDSNSYRVKIRSGEFEVEVEGPDRDYVDAKVSELLRWFDAESSPREVPGQPPAGPAISEDGIAPSLLEHVRRVGPRGGLEYALAVGFYLENVDGMTGGFRRRDLAAGFRKIRYSHSNPGVPISSGRKQGLLLDGSEPERVRLSAAASEWVSARLSGE